MKPETFEAERTHLFAIAYRMLGTRAEAEDVIQDAWLRVADDDRDLDSPRAYLTTVVSRLCLDALKSARARRESYVGPWLPEPIFDEPASGKLELAESLSIAFLMLLERLSPLERAAFLLREVFDVPYGDVARILESTEPACRQLVARARTHVDEGRPRFTAPMEKKTALLHAFAAACATGDRDALSSMLADDAKLSSDGGGKTYAALKPIYGPDRVIRFLFGVLKKTVNESYSLEPILVNGEPGIVLVTPLRKTVVTISVSGERITDIWFVANPEKLTSL